MSCNKYQAWFRNFDSTYPESPDSTPLWGLHSYIQYTPQLVCPSLPKQGLTHLSCLLDSLPVTGVTGLAPRLKDKKMCKFLQFQDGPHQIDSQVSQVATNVWWMFLERNSILDQLRIEWACLLIQFPIGQLSELG